ncbi:uncharacterized protein TRUGW13939_04724 [Talaromyces rugulosus]|uniref:Uncharacterized protein n=1 Tax=Talaromyces rugulosus TaxID=121627 RepID=A0A7H8QUX8_TALRU|nr:uncharacterized protein TRUGW13939_04724 [Talaromyces rugulosus]QKX57606.1 hypothetical protein TRUGW13939_04724 [Talaromyces rugulosus]
MTSCALTQLDVPTLIHTEAKEHPSKNNKTPYHIRPHRLNQFIHSNYFWGLGSFKRPDTLFAVPCSGYAEARTILPEGPSINWHPVLEKAFNKLQVVFDEVEALNTQEPKTAIAEISLSSELQAWRKEQHKAGRVLPSKGYGLTRASDTVIDILGVRDWPPPLLTNAALFGSGFANFLIGAYDPEVLFSNYCVDMGFFYEHGYNKVFPEYEPVIRWAATDAHAMATVGGTERRTAAEMGLKYIRRKIALEDESIGNLSNKTAKMTRKESLAVNFCECSLLGMAAELLAHGSDRGAVINDFAFGSPGTDVIDVGSDIHNSELFNSFLNTGEITEEGIVTEDALRRVYDAYAHSSARMFTERWSEPGVRMCSMLFTWHIQNNRHDFLRRAVLGYCKVRNDRSTGQREADIDEVFDEDLHTTGFSRPLKGSCNGEAVCDQVHERLERSHGDPLLKELWHYLGEAPVDYASRGLVDPNKENELAEGSRIAMARAYSYGLADDLAWFLAHASQHAWQVNYLFEAAMFGSLLDDGGLKGQLDRFT